MTHNHYDSSLIMTNQGPLLAEWDIELDSGQLVLLPSKFISDLSKLIEPSRPQARRNKNIPVGDR